MSKAFYKFLWFLNVSLLLAVVVVFLLFDVNDRTPYQEKPYYLQMKSTMDNLSIASDTSGTFKAGWAKKSITPDKIMSLAGYGLKGEYTTIHDSIYCRTMVLSKGSQKAAIISLDLLIFPPIVAREAIARLSEKGYDEANLFFSATHTHNSVGGWADGLAGRLMAGKYNSDYIRKITDAIVETVSQAESTTMEAYIGFDKFDANEYVLNRLDGENGSIDPYVRVIKVQTAKSKAYLSTFSAHAVCISPFEHAVSGDYPGMLIQKLESLEDTDFAIFCAGAVGSHNPTYLTKENFEAADSMATGLFHKISAGIDNIKVDTIGDLSTTYFPVYLREPHFKVSENVRFRPWVFNIIFGSHQPGMRALKIGSNVLIGTPCDFSGELIAPLEAYYNEKGLNLMVTSFNGGYIGYITDDKHYDLNKPETMEMNWFGPYNGKYFSEIILTLRDKL